MGEAGPSEREGDGGWPKVITIPTLIHSLGQAHTLYGDAGEEGDSEVEAAIEDAINYRQLEDGINQWIRTDSSDDFSDDAGFIFEYPNDAYAVFAWLERSQGLDAGNMAYVDHYGRGTLAVSDQQLAEVIGNWLKSISVPFKYNVEPEGQPEERPTAPVLPPAEPGSA